MVWEMDFISKVEAHPILYKTNKKCKSKGVDEINDSTQPLWTQIALDCGLPSAIKAKELWQQLLAQYLEYLRDGGDFPAASRMQFVQMSLLQSTEEDGDSSSDMELDEAELERILSADSSCEKSASVPALAPAPAPALAPAPAKRSRRDSEEGSNSENVNKRKTVEAPIEKSDANSSPGNFSNLTSLELIFLGYAKVLQKMPLPLQLQTKRKIADVMDEAEMQLYAQK